MQSKTRAQGDTGTIVGLGETQGVRVGGVARR
jgi:hypothetical protein